MDINNYVIETINKKHSREDLNLVLMSDNYSFKELEHAFSSLMRSRRMTSNKEKAFCFIELYITFRRKSQYPTYPDPKSGCIPTKIKSIQEFIEHNQHSIFGFITELNELLQNM